VRRRQHVNVYMASTDTFCLAIGGVTKIDAMALNCASGVTGDCIAVAIDIEAAAEPDKAGIDCDYTVSGMHSRCAAATSATFVGRITGGDHVQFADSIVAARTGRERLGIAGADSGENDLVDRRLDELFGDHRVADCFTRLVVVNVEYLFFNSRFAVLIDFAAAGSDVVAHLHVCLEGNRDHADFAKCVRDTS